MKVPPVVVQTTPSFVHNTPVVDPTLLRPSGKVHVDKPGLSRTTWVKCTKRKGKASTSLAPPPWDDEDCETTNFLPPYILPKSSDALKVKIPKQTCDPRIAPLFPK